MKYWLTIRYGMRDSHTYTINAKDDNEFRKIAIAKYGRDYRGFPFPEFKNRRPQFF